MQRNPGRNAAGLDGAGSDNGIANREGVEAGKWEFAAAPSSDIHGQDDVLRVGTEVAEHLRISQSSVYKLIDRQQIPAIRIGRLLRVRKKSWTRLCAQWATTGELTLDESAYLAVNVASTLPDPTADESPDTSAIFPMRV